MFNRKPVDDSAAALDERLVGRVLRASTTGYAAGTRASNLVAPAFGAFVQTSHRNGGEIDIIGLIYSIRIDDDPLVRQLIMANNINAATVRDQRENRMIPVEVGVVNVGYRAGGQSFHTLPPRPPMSLDPVVLCDDDTVRDFTESTDFFRLVLNTSEVPTEELLAAALKHAAAARPYDEQRPYLITAGRRLAQLLSYDLTRLNHLLRLIRP
ncbi:MAG: hypothetical protein IT323_15505 [Anaerolineae bacterium]|nr:hypothetical protein [Anaerolineae bacterium]